MQGVYVNGERPKTKRAMREAIADAPHTVRIEATSWFGDEYDGSIVNMPCGTTVYFVGPDPHTKRSWYGSIVRNNDGKVVVK